MFTHRYPYQYRQYIVMYYGRVMQGLLEPMDPREFFQDFYMKEPGHIHRVRTAYGVRRTAYAHALNALLTCICHHTHIVTSYSSRCSRHIPYLLSCRLHCSTALKLGKVCQSDSHTVCRSKRNAGTVTRLHVVSLSLSHTLRCPSSLVYCIGWKPAFVFPRNDACGAIEPRHLAS